MKIKKRGKYEQTGARHLIRTTVRTLHQPANTWRRPLSKCIATAKFLDMPNLAEKFEQTILQITN